MILKQLEVENKVNINDPVTKYLPWFKTSKEITLKDLMLHESGLHKYEASTNIKNLDQAVKSIQQKVLMISFIISINIMMGII